MCDKNSHKQLLSPNNMPVTFTRCHNSSSVGLCIILCMSKGLHGKKHCLLIYSVCVQLISLFFSIIHDMPNTDKNSYNGKTKSKEKNAGLSAS